MKCRPCLDFEPNMPRQFKDNQKAKDSTVGKAFAI